MAEKRGESGEMREVLEKTRRGLPKKEGYLGANLGSLANRVGVLDLGLKGKEPCKNEA